ncbi:MAG: Crp/Fnr family transcriptional regulator [Saprospiraceae bacterium]|nr:Crp/Fnr family transcriptional regulator [Saprospiraceae bacterium]MCB0625837.1 Crp/Fnr family transcriptional regulator [Saprospiraceae bacterium]MCB0676998.1 Crp/Fnr family transcriptional regulator [Saprospiraceae bacterium]MCB0680807.1 Crp/Fnr family transcriptional regulator [Saprospiraceae bacterium]
MNAAITTPTIVDHISFFDVLTSEERRRLGEMMEFKIKPKYSFIYLPDEPSDTVFFLEKGTVKIGTHSPDGKEVIKSLIHPKAMFGELGLIGETNRQDFAQALKEPVHLYTLKVEDFKRLMRSNYGLCDRVMSQFGTRLMKAESKLESLIFKDARTRIIEFIKDSVQKRGRRIGYEMLLKHSLTHQDIANITCTSRQTVTLVLNELRKSDLIYFNRGKILVRDMTKLT